MPEGVLESSFNVYTGWSKKSGYPVLFWG